MPMVDLNVCPCTAFSTSGQGSQIEVGTKDALFLFITGDIKKTDFSCCESACAKVCYDILL